MIQAESVLEFLARFRPDCSYEIVRITTSGDSTQGKAPDWSPEVGIFVKELESHLMSGDIDLAVHSLKDMPTDLAAGLKLAAVPKRVDPRDVLVSAKGKLAQMPDGSRIGTGSPRRRVQVLRRRPDVRVEPIRGNVDTRLGKVASGELDAIILAAAGLARLGAVEHITEYLDPPDFIPAAGQGALAIEARADDHAVLELAAALNDPDSLLCVTAERAFLQFLGAGCRTPVGVLGQVAGGSLRLQCMVSDLAGEAIIVDSEEGTAQEAEELGIRLAERVLRTGGSSIIEAIRC